MPQVKKLPVFAALSLTLATPVEVWAQDVPATELTNLQLAREIVDRGYPVEGRMDMFTSFVDELISQMRTAGPAAAGDAQLSAVLDKYGERVVELTRKVLGRHLDEIMEGMVLAYADTFTRDELEGLHAFISSPAGEGFLARSMAVMSHPAYAQANQDYMADYMRQMPGLEAELRAELSRLAETRNK